MLKYIFYYLIVFKLVMGYINIYPPYFYEKLENNQIFKEFTLSNTRKTSIRYRLYIEDSTSTQLNSDIKVEVYPKSITLKPFEKRNIRVLINGDSKISREFTKTLVIKEIELPGEKKKILTMFKLKLSGFSGSLVPKLEYKEKAGNLVIKNIGNRVGVYEIYNEKDEFLDSFILRKGEDRRIETNEKKLILKEKFEGDEIVRRGVKL